jgi:hypothetical protein
MVDRLQGLLVLTSCCCCCCCCFCCSHGPNRANYIGDFWKVVDWAQVSKNFAAAKAGKIQLMVA